MIVHPRTLEVLRPLGVVDELLARTDRSPWAHIHLGSRVVPVCLGGFALPDTAYPHLTLARQMDVETVLAQALAERGVPIERGVELAGLCQQDGPRAQLRSKAGVEEVDCGFVVGCDGAGSNVRELSGIGWRGGRYRHEVILADIELDGLPPGEAHIVPTRRGLVFVFAMGEQATWRVLATRPTGEASQSVEPILESGDELQLLLAEAGLAVRITKVAWSETVQLQHRLASRYRQGRVFLAGDAAHVHSPAAAQGMNTGIQDAVNLGWKLAFSHSSGDPDRLLDSYELERRPAARQVLALTHLVFWAESGTDPVATFVRGRLAPIGAPLIPLMMSRRRLVAEGVRMLSQLRVAYRGSPLSVEGTPHMRGPLHAGDRMPDRSTACDGRAVRMHELLARPGVHVLLQRDAKSLPVELCGPYVHVHRLSDEPGAGVTAVRPDGYIGFRSDAVTSVEPQLGRWLAGVGAS
jgi:2-polyprenyl-6-methoxyphenol hydroxylase-like FAD-dependent oxidoreductase